MQNEDSGSNDEILCQVVRGMDTKDVLSPVFPVISCVAFAGGLWYRFIQLR